MEQNSTKTNINWEIPTYEKLPAMLINKGFKANFFLLFISKK